VLDKRKARFATLLRRMGAGIVLNDHTDDDGAGVCRQGIVSKRLGAPYRSGPSRHWLKVKNPGSPAMVRARGAVASRDRRQLPMITRWGPVRPAFL
jgi:bifunctional non-homologous end joining protein LigD